LLTPPPHTLSIAPMLDWTDRHCRFFLRQLTRRALLYSEMVTTPAILHGDRERLLGFDPAEQPVALQLGGSDPADLATCARVGAEWGYREINLNVGCPSDRVQSGRFGACLMAEPDLVARCVAAMRGAVDIPVTVKTRLAIDEMEEWPALTALIDAVVAVGGTRFIVHARKAWLKGLSPKENRSVPPLRYDLVHRLKAERPELDISINGGITTLDGVAEQLEKVDGVMLGRAAYETPAVLMDADRRFYGAENPAPSRRAAVEAMYGYIEAQRTRGVPLHAITRHMLGLFQGVPGARGWRRTIAENAHKPGAGPEVLELALRGL
jgi:tRNA-dihydrouridine synthase A